MLKNSYDRPQNIKMNVSFKGQVKKRFKLREKMSN